MSRDQLIVTYPRTVVGGQVASIFNEASYVIEKNGSTYNAVNGTTSRVDYTGSNAATVINNTITAVNTAGGGKIFIKAGTYTITTSIVPKNKVWIQGEGVATVLYGSGTGFSVIQLLGSIGSPLTDFVIEDLMIDGTGLVDASYNVVTKGIFITYMLRCHMRNLYLYNIPASGIGTDYMVDCFIHNCIVDLAGRQFVDTVGGNGIGIGTGKYENENSIITDCHVINCGNNGIMIEQQTDTLQSKYIVVADCTVINCNRGFRNSGSAKVKFVNCIAENNTLDGFIISNNSATLRGRETIIAFCHANNNGDNGIEIADDDSLEKIFLITGCEIYANTSHGIRLRNSQHIISNNLIYNNGRVGIRNLSASYVAKDIQILGNQIFNNGQASVSNETAGIKLEETGTGTNNNIMIANNRIYDNQDLQTQTHGVVVSGDNDRLTLVNNDLVGNLTAATSLTAGTNTINDNNQT